MSDKYQRALCNKDKVMFFWDIDGVLRDLAGRVFPNGTYDWLQEDSFGRKLVDIVNCYPELLLLAEPHKDRVLMCNLFRDKSWLLSHQPPAWRHKTDMWVKKYIPKLVDRITYVLDQNQKLEILNHYRNSYLIEDNPTLPIGDRIILIDYAYNRGVNTPNRVIDDSELLLKLFNIVKAPRHDET